MKKLATKLGTQSIYQTNFPLLQLFLNHSNDTVLEMTVTVKIHYLKACKRYSLLTLWMNSPQYRTQNAG